MGENGERRINWDFDRMPRTPQALVEKELGTGETLRWYGSSYCIVLCLLPVLNPKSYDGVWELRIRRELEEEGWANAES